MGPRLLEGLGLRGLHVAASRVLGLEPIPKDGPGEVGRRSWDAAAREARLFCRLNFGRALLYVPHLWAASAAGVGWARAYTATMMAFHGALALGEAYRAAQARALMATASEEGRPAPAPRAGADLAYWFFRPKAFESERLYRLMGVEAFRRFVVWLMRSLTPGSLEFIPSGGASAVVAYERQTRASEAVHWLLGLLVLPIIVGAWQSGGGLPFAWSLVILWGDAMLALLQRYQRLRLWPVVARARERAA